MTAHAHVKRSTRAGVFVARLGAASAGREALVATGELAVALDALAHAVSDPELLGPAASAAAAATRRTHEVLERFVASLEQKQVVA